MCPLAAADAVLVTGPWQSWWVPQFQRKPMLPHLHTSCSLLTGYTVQQAPGLLFQIELRGLKVRPVTS
jgi:hypothetical protein